MIFLQGFFVALALRDFGKDRDEAADAAVRPAQRLDRDFLREDFPGLALVPQFAAPVADAGQLRPQPAVELRVVQAGFEQARVLVDDFLAGIAGNAAEGIIDPEDAAARVGDDRAFGHRRKCHLVLAAFLFAAQFFQAAVAGEIGEGEQGGQAEDPDPQVPVLDRQPGRLLGRPVGIQVDRDGRAAAQAADRNQRVAVAFQAFLFHAHRNHRPHQPVLACLGQHFGDHVAAFLEGIERLLFPVVRCVVLVAQLFRGQPFAAAGGALVARLLNRQQQVDRRHGDQAQGFAVAADRRQALLLVQRVVLRHMIFEDENAFDVGGPLADRHVLLQVGHGVDASQGAGRPVQLFALGKQRGEHQEGPDDDSQENEFAARPTAHGTLCRNHVCCSSLGCHTAGKCRGYGE